MTIENNVENIYFLVKWTSDSYTLQYSPKIGRQFIKADELACYSVYLNTFDNFKQWYTPYGGGMKFKKIQVEYCYFN